MSKVRVKSKYVNGNVRYVVQFRRFLFWIEYDWETSRDRAMQTAQRLSGVLDEMKNFKSEVIKY
jgi:hypothetical protein